MTVAPPPSELILEPAEISPRLRAWLAGTPAAQTVTLEQLADGRLIVRPMPDVDPLLLAHLRVTIARYREALTNLS